MRTILSIAAVLVTTTAPGETLTATNINDYSVGWVPGAFQLGMSLPGHPRLLLGPTVTYADEGLQWIINESTAANYGVDWSKVETAFTTPRVKPQDKHGWQVVWGPVVRLPLNQIGLRGGGGLTGGWWDEVHSVSLTVDSYRGASVGGTLRVTGVGHHEFVPEPASWVLVLLGLAAFARVRVGRHGSNSLASELGGGIRMK